MCGTRSQPNSSSSKFTAKSRLTGTAADEAALCGLRRTRGSRTTENHGRRAARVLVVEEDRVVPQVTPGMLDVYGYESHAISDGARALDWLGTSH